MIGISLFTIWSLNKVTVSWQKNIFYMIEISLFTIWSINKVTVSWQNNIFYMIGIFLFTIWSINKVKERRSGMVIEMNCNANSTEIMNLIEISGIQVEYYKKCW